MVKSTSDLSFIFLQMSFSNSELLDKEASEIQIIGDSKIVNPT